MRSNEQPTPEPTADPVNLLLHNVTQKSSAVFLMLY
jgi:hypothetical protein